MSAMARNCLKPVTACLAAALELVPAVACSTSLVVNSCLDDGSLGSLRQRVAAANSKDTIDLSTNALACSTITLTQGEINVTQPYLYFVGPTDRTVTITTSATNRLLHQPTGVRLGVSNLSLSGGYYETYYTPSARGGCIESQGYVTLSSAVVSGCKVYSAHNYAAGGAIFAAAVRLESSIVTGNVASSLYDNARGGGIATLNVAIMYSSTLSGNTATASRVGMEGSGGGAYASGVLQVSYSVIDSNTAQVGGGLAGTNGLLVVSNSTISGNFATSTGGGITAHVENINIRGSTIAFNVSSSAAVYADSSMGSMVAESSIIAKNRNTSGSGFADLYVKNGSLSSTGLNNLIISINVAPAPGVIVSSADPQLAPLAYHGGPTRTHALLATSPAVDHGYNPGGLINGVRFDQRGFGFSREVPVGSPDIGAYERQVNDDEIYYNGFD